VTLAFTSCPALASFTKITKPCTLAMPSPLLLVSVIVRCILCLSQLVLIQSYCGHIFFLTYNSLITKKHCFYSQYEWTFYNCDEQRYIRTLVALAKLKSYGRTEDRILEINNLLLKNMDTKAKDNCETRLYNTCEPPTTMWS
jgi:hypothetical protein